MGSIFNLSIYNIYLYIIMTDYLNFLGENQAYQSIKQFGQQKEEAYKEQQQQGIFDLVESIPLFTDVIEKGKGIYEKGVKLYETGKKAVDTLSENVGKVKDVVEQGVEKVKGKLSEVRGLAQETKDAILKKAQEFNTLGQGEISNLKAKYGDKFNTELQNLNEQKSKVVKDLTAQVDKKRMEIIQKKNDLTEQLGRDLTPTEEKQFSTEFAIFRKELDGKFITINSDLENSFKSKLSQSISKVQEGVGQKISRRLNIQDFERDPEEFSPSKLSLGLGQKVQSVFRGGTSPKIPSIEIPKGTEIKGLIPDVKPLQQEGIKMAEQAKEKVAGVISDVKGDIGRVSESVISKGQQALGEGVEIGQKAVSIGSEAVSAVTETAESVGSIVAESIPVVGQALGATLALYEGVKSLFEPKPHLFSTARPTYTAGI